MNTLEAKLVKTCYAYDEFYWVVDGQPITTYLEQHRPESLSAFGSLSGLLPAWSGKLIWQWENDLVWEMVSSEEELNVPILVCEDDCDLSCIVITAHIRKTETFVYWAGSADWTIPILISWNITKAGFSAWSPIRMKTGKTTAATLGWIHMEAHNIGNG